MRAERPRSIGAALLLAALTSLPAAAADEHIFEPGSKHVCVPAANGEGWDCRSAEEAPAAPAAAAPREPRLRSSSEIPAEPALSAAAAEEAAAAADPLPQAAPAASAAPSSAAPARHTAPASASASAPDATPSSRNVPHYLLSPEARGSTSAAAPAAPTPAAVAGTRPAQATSTPPPVQANAEPARAAAAPATASPPPVASDRTTGAPAAAAATPAADAAPAQPPHSEPPPAQIPASAGVALLGAGEFRRLADTRYVVELASGANRGEVESRAAAAAPAQGRVYLLPLRRDGADWYLAVWGDFDSVDAARSARAQALAEGVAGLGWPRRAGPLKQELGR